MKLFLGLSPTRLQLPFEKELWDYTSTIQPNVYTSIVPISPHHQPSQALALTELYNPIIRCCGRHLCLPVHYSPLPRTSPPLPQTSSPQDPTTADLIATTRSRPPPRQTLRLPPCTSPPWALGLGSVTSNGTFTLDFSIPFGLPLLSLSPTLQPQ